MAKDITIIKITIKPVSKGHQAHRSGAGHHGDRRLKRLKTRQRQYQAALAN